MGAVLGVCFPETQFASNGVPLPRNPNDIVTDHPRELWEAAKDGDAKECARLLGKGEDPNVSRAPDGTSGLMYAAMHGNVEVATVLLNYVGVQRMDGKQHGSERYKSKALRTNVDQTSGPKRETALHCSARTGMTLVAELLIRNKARVNATDQLLRTPLHVACLAGHDDFVEMLLKSGAEVAAKNVKGLTAREVAMSAGLSNIVRLIDGGDDLLLDDDFGEEDEGEEEEAEPVDEAAVEQLAATAEAEELAEDVTPAAALIGEEADRGGDSADV